nr:FGGY-family carbohydrate kinase [Mongoliimonas terrestris]
MTRLVAVLDIGKTNAKLVVHDVATGADLFVRTMPNTVRPGPPYPHMDTDALHAFALGALKDAAAAHAIDAVSITTHGASVALMAGDDLALPVLDYEHDGPDALSAAYDAARPAFAETFSPRLAGGLNVGAQLFWLERTFPDAFGRVTAILPYPQYWAFRLTGVMAAEVTSLGCHTDLWRPADGTPSSLATEAGWAARLPPVRSAFEALGPVSPAVVAATGLKAGTPVHCGIHDSNASLLPHLMTRRAPFAVVSTGTWVVIFAVGGRPDGLDPGRDTLANVDAFGRPVPGARFMGGREVELLTGGRPETPDRATLDRVIEQGVMALPTFVPKSGPFPNGKGRWTTDPDRLSAAERTAAASLYAALMTAEALGLAGARGPVVIEGPFARNAVFTSALAALVPDPVLPVEGATGTSAGAALLALGPEGRPTARVEPAAAVPLDGGFPAYAAHWRAAAAGS